MSPKKSAFSPKLKFTLQDDQRLLKVVEETGTSNWRIVADKMPGRNPRQCRERWTNYVNPELKKDPWTTEEEELLLRKYNELGPRWHTIASFLGSRSTNQIKNRYSMIMRRPKQNRNKDYSESGMEDVPIVSKLPPPRPPVQIKKPSPHPEEETLAINPVMEQNEIVETIVPEESEDSDSPDLPVTNPIQHIVQYRSPLRSQNAVLMNEVLSMQLPVPISITDIQSTDIPNLLNHTNTNSTSNEAVRSFNIVNSTATQRTPEQFQFTFPQIPGPVPERNTVYDNASSMSWVSQPERDVNYDRRYSSLNSFLLL